MLLERVLVTGGGGPQGFDVSGTNLPAQTPSTRQENKMHLGAPHDRQELLLADLAVLVAVELLDHRLELFIS